MGGLADVIFYYDHIVVYLRMLSAVEGGSLVRCFSYLTVRRWKIDALGVGHVLHYPSLLSLLFLKPCNINMLATILKSGVYTKTINRISGNCHTAGRTPAYMVPTYMYKVKFSVPLFNGVQIQMPNRVIKSYLNPSQCSQC